MVLNVDIYNFDGGSDPRASWRYNVASLEEACSIFSEAARKTSYVKLVMLVDGRLHGLAYRHGQFGCSVITSYEEMIDF